MAVALISGALGRTAPPTATRPTPPSSHIAQVNLGAPLVDTEWEALVKSLSPENATLLLRLAAKPEVAERIVPDSVAGGPDYDPADLRETLDLVLPGDDLGRIWTTPGLDRSDFVVVQSTAQPDGLARLHASATKALRGRVKVIGASRSMSELDAIKETAATSVLPEDSSVGLALRGNDRTEAGAAVVRFQVPASILSDDLINRFKRVVPVDLLEVEVGRVAPDATLATNRNVYPPLRGGARIVPQPGLSSGASCTTGYMYGSQFGPLGSTAGHCYKKGRTGDGNKVNSHDMDIVRNNQFDQGSTTYSDVAVFSVYGWSYSKGVMINDTVTRQVTSRYNGNRGIGDPYCAVGSGSLLGVSRTEQLCGEITKVNATANVNDPGSGTSSHLVNLNCGDADGPQGWSGGPVYLTLASGRLKAAGTLSTGELGGTCWTIINATVFWLNAEIDFSP